jgi:arsenate reductase
VVNLIGGSANQPPMSEVTIFHNPNCGTSRNTLAMIKAAGYEPEVVEYVKAGWTAEGLKALFAKAGVTPRQAMRTKGSLAEELGLLKDGVSDEAILAAMVEHPILVERPFVVGPKGAVLCRPSEKVFGVLEQRPDRFVKEDGEVV